jgi:hypothetical protein
LKRIGRPGKNVHNHCPTIQSVGGKKAVVNEKVEAKKTRRGKWMMMKRRMMTMSWDDWKG